MTINDCLIIIVCLVSYSTVVLWTMIIVLAIAIVIIGVIPYSKK